MKLGDESHKSKLSMRDIVHLTNVKKSVAACIIAVVHAVKCLRNASLLFASPVQACI
jgi:hypothetical protein